MGGEFHLIAVWKNEAINSSHCILCFPAEQNLGVCFYTRVCDVEKGREE